MAVSKIKLVVDDKQSYKSVNDCSSLEAVFNALLSTKNGIVNGTIGSQSSNNLKTLLGSPNLGSYVDCHIILLSMVDYGNIFAIAIAGNVLTSDSSIKTKYLMKKQNGQYQQTSWV